MVGAERRAAARPDLALSLRSSWTWDPPPGYPRACCLPPRPSNPASNTAGAAWTGRGRADYHTAPADRRAATLPRPVIDAEPPARRTGRIQPPPRARRGRWRGLLLAAFSACYAVAPPRRQHRHRPHVLQQPALAAARHRVQPGLPAVQRPAGGRDRRARAGGSRRHRRRAGRQALGRITRISSSVRRPDASPFLQQGGAAVSRYQAVDRPDGPHHRRAAVPRPARRRSRRRAACSRRCRCSAWA